MSDRLVMMAGGHASTDQHVRSLIVTERRFDRSLAAAALDEAEDLLVRLGGAQLYRLDRRDQRQSPRLRRAVGRSLRRAAGPRVLLPPRSAGAPVRDGPYDLAVAVLYSVWNLPLLEAIPGLRDSGRIVGWFPEVWPPQLDDRLALEPFAILDEIFVGEPRSAALLERLLQRPVHVLPVATDVEVFSDGGRVLDRIERQRPIDVCNIGRRDPALHLALAEWSARTDAYYVYDTTSGATVVDPAAHRMALAGQLRRTRVKIASHAKHDEPEVTGGVRWLPARVWDGLASGAVLAGFPPDPDAQRDLFGREVVHPLPEGDPAAAVATIAELTSGCAAAERRANVRTAMAGHDWSHRWVEVFRTCGLRPPPGVLQRAQRLTRQGVAGSARGRAQVDLRPTGSQDPPPDPSTAESA